MKNSEITKPKDENLTDTERKRNYLITAGLTDYIQDQTTFTSWANTTSALLSLKPKMKTALDYSATGLGFVVNIVSSIIPPLFPKAMGPKVVQIALDAISKLGFMAYFNFLNLVDTYVLALQVNDPCKNIDGTNAQLAIFLAASFTLAIPTVINTIYTEYKKINKTPGEFTQEQEETLREAVLSSIAKISKGFAMGSSVFSIINFLEQSISASANRCFAPRLIRVMVGNSVALISTIAYFALPAENQPVIDKLGYVIDTIASITQTVGNGIVSSIKEGSTGLYDLLRTGIFATANFATAGFFSRRLTQTEEERPLINVSETDTIDFSTQSNK